MNNVCLCPKESSSGQTQVSLKRLLALLIRSWTGRLLHKADSSFKCCDTQRINSDNAVETGLLTDGLITLIMSFWVSTPLYTLWEVYGSILNECSTVLNIEFFSCCCFLNSLWLTLVSLTDWIGRNGRHSSFGHALLPFTFHSAYPTSP